MKNVKKPWTDTETRTLVKLWDNDTAIPEIARVLCRPVTHVRAKVSHLRSTRPELKKQLRYRLAHPDGKLKAQDIPKIRKDTRALRLIGNDYGVSAVTIFKVKARETWRDA
jgi:hypothetical protein